MQLVVSTDLHPHAHSELVSGASGGDLSQQGEEIEADANELGTLVDTSPAHTKSRDVQVDEILRLTGSSHIEAVSYKAAGRGQVFRESWSRRARRSKVLQNEGIEGPGNISQPLQPLFDFAVLLQRLGLPATLPVQEVQKVREDRGGGCNTGGDSVGDGGVGRIAVWDGGTDSGCSDGGQEAGTVLDGSAARTSDKGAKSRTVFNLMQNLPESIRTGDYAQATAWLRGGVWLKPRALHIH